MRSDWIPAVTHTDRLIGATLGKLASLNMSESTAVVVIGDHGYELGEHNMWVSHGSSLSTHWSPVQPLLLPQRGHHIRTSWLT
eukprot:COSAG01_NODE_25054_length_757_cov_0.860182_2_plen_83_part_00